MAKAVRKFNSLKLKALKRPLILELIDPLR